MKALSLILRKTLKNLIKEIFRKPLLLIWYILIVLFVAFMIFVSFIMPSATIRSGSPKLFVGIVTLAFSFMYYTYLKLGIEKGSTYFRMSDVNIALTAPIKPNQILIYAFIKQIGGTLLFLFIAICQIPNLKNNFKMQPYGAVMVLLAAMLFSLSYPLIGMIVYSWSTKKVDRKKNIKRIFNLSALGIVAIVLISLAINRDLVKTLEVVFYNPLARFFPIIGWTASIANSAVLGFTVEFWVGIVGMSSLIIGALFVLYRVNLDYYEDVLEGTEFMEAAIKAKREGNNMAFNLKVNKNVKQKLSGSGAAAIFYKQLMEIKKTAYFLFIDRTSITVIIASVIFKFIMPEEASTYNLIMILAFSLYMLLLIQVQGRLNNELEKHYIFLIPESSSKKLFYATLSEHAKNFFDGTILFIVSGILFKAPVSVIIACALTYTLFGAVYTYTDVLSRRIFGSVHSKGMLVFIKVFSNILIIIPGVIAAVIAMIFTESEFYAVCALGGWSLILATTLFVFSSGILNNLETAN